MPVDASIFNNIHNYQDYNMANQDFLARQKAAQLDAATKANVLKAQVVGAGAGSGDQDTYLKAVQSLQQMGIDTSDVPADINAGVGYANAAINAQKPYALGNAQIKAIGANAAGISALGSQGDATAAGLSIPVPQGAITPAQARTLPPQAITRSAPRTPIANQVQAGTPEGVQALNDLYGDNSAPAAPVVLTQNNTVPSQPVKAADETPANFNARLAAWNDQPLVIQAKAKSTATGKDQAEAEKAAIGASANYDQVVQTINGITDLNHSVAGLPQDRGFVPAKAKAYLAQNFGDTDIGNAFGVPSQALADNANKFTKLNEAQTIGAIKELASTGQIRMTRTLENILNRGYLIEPGASPKSKDEQAQTILTELENSKIAAQNVNTGLNGGQSLSMQPIPASGQIQTQQPEGAPKLGTKIPGTDGDYIFNGGDPADPKSWKKVK